MMAVMPPGAAIALLEGTRVKWNVLLPLAGFALAGVAFAGGAESAAWDPRAAAAYLDQRAEWWIGWQRAALDHDTFCVSCHTSLTYALGRPALRQAAGETGASPGERRILENVRRRVRLWSETEPYYSDAKRGVPKTAESRSTESVLNALILTVSDARTGESGAETVQALDHMLALQFRTGEQAGAWQWLDFHNQPWEAGDSQFWGSTLAAVAIGSAPAAYRSTPAVRDALALLRGYLLREEGRQSGLNRLGLLWAASLNAGLLPQEARDRIVKESLSRQRADGGWSSASLLSPDWKRRDGTALESGSDGYVTALAAFALERSGTPGSAPGIERALAWLAANQDRATGRVPAWSPNLQRDPATDAGRLMSDAATAWAALAMERR